MSLLEQVVLEFVHQLDALDLCVPSGRLCHGHGRQGYLPDRVGRAQDQWGGALGDHG